MKKILAAILVVILLSALTIPVLAAPGGEDMGTIPMTNIPITLDGIKDDVYNHGLIIHMDQPNNDLEGGSGGGVSYLLWSAEGYLYIFQEVKVHGWLWPENYEMFGMGAEALTYPMNWLLHGTEVSIDFDNEGIAHSKFMGNPADGFFGVHVQDDIGMGMGWFTSVDRASYWLEGHPERYMQTVTRIIDDNNYTVEHRIDLNAFIRDGVATKGPFAPGSELGIHFAAAETLEVFYDAFIGDDNILIHPGWGADVYVHAQIGYFSWDAGVGIESNSEFNYVVLGELIAATTLSTAVDTPADTGDAGDAGSDTGTGGGQRRNEQHGDASALAFMIPGMLAAAAVIFKKARK
jgi:hypothetical protein